MKLLVWMFAVVLLVNQWCLSQVSPGAVRLGKLKPGPTATDLLEGRLTIHLPVEAKIQPMLHGIMSAPESNAEQTRVVINAGTQRMVIMTYELFALAGNDFESQVRKQSAGFPMKVDMRKWPLSAPLKGYAYFPVAPSQNEEANLLMGLYVVRSDGTAQELRAYVNPAGAKNLSEVTALAEMILRTVAKGKKRLDLSGGDRTLWSSFAEMGEIRITVPPDYILTKQQGPDFLVYHMRKLGALDVPNKSIGIYLGSYPEKPEGYAKKDSGVLAGEPVDWYEKISQEEGESFVESRTLVTFSFRPQGFTKDAHLYADVFLQAPDEAGIEELKKVAAGLKRVPPSLPKAMATPGSNH